MYFAVMYNENKKEADEVKLFSKQWLMENRKEEI